MTFSRLLAGALVVFAPTGTARALNPLIEHYQAKLRALQEEIKSLETKTKDAPELTARRAERDAVQALLRPLEARRQFVTHAETEAAVDSELSLLWWDNYDLRRWQ